MTRRAAEELGCKPLARVIGKMQLRIIETRNEFFLAFADAETNPVDFSVAPALAIPKVRKRIF
jgi:acetyl-CoA C-acetyltransferase